MSITQRIFTDAYLYLPAYIDEVEALVEHLDRLSETPSGSLLPSGCELVLQVTFEEWEGASSVIWQYYYVHHKTRSLFWLRDFEVGEYLGEILGPVSPAHFSAYIREPALYATRADIALEHMLQSWYWFVSLLPAPRKRANHFTGITSPTSQIAFSLMNPLLKNLSET